MKVTRPSPLAPPQCQVSVSLQALRRCVSIVLLLSSRLSFHEVIYVTVYGALVIIHGDTASADAAQASSMFERYADEILGTVLRHSL